VFLMRSFVDEERDEMGWDQELLHLSLCWRGVFFS